MPIQTPEFYYYELRWVLLGLINKFMRPDLRTFFSNYTTSSLESNSKAILLVMALLLFPVISFSFRIIIIRGEAVVLSLLGLSCRAHLRLTLALALSLLCPTPIFLYYAFPLLLLLSLCPCLYNSILYCFHAATLPPTSAILDSFNYNHESLYYYELRWILLLLINHFLRPYLTILFSDYIILQSSLLVSLALLLVLFFTYLNMCLTNDSNGRLVILLRLGCRGGWSNLIASALLFAVLCPTPIFLYVYPFILLLSLWPSTFLNFLLSFLYRLYAALSAFLAFNAPIIPCPTDAPVDNEAGHHQHLASMV